MSAQQALALPLPAASNTVVINARCSLRIAAGQRVIVVAGLPVHHYRAEDAVAEAYAMVFSVESGFAQQTDVAQAFARSMKRSTFHLYLLCSSCRNPAQMTFAKPTTVVIPELPPGIRSAHRSGKRLRHVRLLGEARLHQNTIA